MEIKLPKAPPKLIDLAYNLWFSWNPDVRDLYKEIDERLWRRCGNNPVEFLFKVDPLKLQQVAADAAFIDKLEKVWERYHAYVTSKDTAYAKNFPRLADHSIAYFSAEYGIHECLPNYAGGLGILAGDHIKSCSDLGIPIFGIGLMYKHAYFQQQIDVHGNQSEIFNVLDPARLPVQLVKDEYSNPVLVEVPLLDHVVYVKIWEVKVGRASVYYLDTTVDQNSDEDKDIIHILYGGSRDTRIRQEIILGIGGLRAIRKMGLNPSIFHINEGHSAFMCLERLYELMNEGMDFKTAQEYVRATTIFTTHTPVPAGNEEFEFDMIDKYFTNMWPELEISHEKFFDLGRNTNIHKHENFSLTILALNLSNQANGVSKLHGEVSQEMWQKVWSGIPIPEIPIGYVTNGVHTFTWLHREMARLFDRYLDPIWRTKIRDQNFWDKVFDLPNEVFWQVKKKLKQEMITLLRQNYRQRIERYGENYGGYPPATEILNPDVLTIGFARRFAPYKRALLFFKDPERVRKILNNPDGPVQIIFAGKAHPANDAGKDLIRRINEISKEEGFRGRVIFIEDYNMNNARALISGVDIWLNTPRRPMEASGTSGQKVPINGGVNISILDGWWAEGYNNENGWAIGQARPYEDHERQDIDDSNSLYDLLEKEVIPLYYSRDAKGIPQDWILKVKHSLHSTITQFSAHRMVWNYLQQYYLPCIKRAEKYSQEEYKELHQFSKWKNRVQRLWKNVRLTVKNGPSMDVDRRILSAGETRDLVLHVDSGGLEPEDLRVEVILQRHDTYHLQKDLKVIPMGLVAEIADGKLEYRAHMAAAPDGAYCFNCRIIPNHPDLFNQHETRLIRWLD
jgi:starch phosphorylase